MDENQLYIAIGKLYVELIGAGNIIQNQNNAINQLQQQVSELELSSSVSNNAFVTESREAQPFQIEDDKNASSLQKVNA